MQELGSLEAKTIKNGWIIDLICLKFVMKAHFSGLLREVASLCALRERRKMGRKWNGLIVPPHEKCSKMASNRQKMATKLAKKLEEGWVKLLFMHMHWKWLAQQRYFKFTMIKYMVLVPTCTTPCDCKSVTMGDIKIGGNLS